MEKYLKTNEFEEAVSALEMVAELVTGMTDDRYRWKWIILSVHQALQGFMVLALRCGDGLRPLKDKVAAAWLQAYRQGGEYPREELDSFLNLYKKIKSDRMLFYQHSMKFLPVGTQGWSVKKLNSLRNDFIHFLPRAYLLEISGVPQICLDCLELVEFLGWQCGNILWHNETWSDRARTAITKSMSRIEDLQRQCIET
jgi:hypothetical protein